MTASLSFRVGVCELATRNDTNPGGMVIAIVYKTIPICYEHVITSEIILSAIAD